MIRGQPHSNIADHSKDRHLTVDNGTSCCDSRHQGEQALLPSSITHVSDDYTIALYTLWISSDFTVHDFSLIRIN